MYKLKRFPNFIVELGHDKPSINISNRQIDLVDVTEICLG